MPRPRKSDDELKRNGTWRRDRHAKRRAGEAVMDVQAFLRAYPMPGTAWVLQWGDLLPDVLLDADLPFLVALRAAVGTEPLAWLDRRIADLGGNADA